MIYVAKHYTKIAGRKYTPGEIIDRPIPDDKRERLLRLKAIESVGAQETEAEIVTMNTPEAENVDAPENTPEAESVDAPENTPEAETIDAPEIDAMEGIVSAESVKKNGRGRRKAQ